MAKNTPTELKNSTIPPINPFFTALNGLSALFARALSVGIVILLLSVIAAAPTLIDNEPTSNQSYDEFSKTVSNLQPEQIAGIAAIVLVITVFMFVVGAMIHGIQSYTALRLARGEGTTIGEAFSAVLNRFGGYIVLYIWMNIKIALWTLLFIIPGIHAYFRYSFAGILFFDKDLKHEAALKESSRLTRGGLMTLFSSNTLFNIITLGYISNIITIATQSELYRIYTELDRTKTAKPGIHGLSWLALALPFIIFLGLISIALIIAITIGLAGGALTR